MIYELDNNFSLKKDNKILIFFKSMQSHTCKKAYNVIIDLDKALAGRINIGVVDVEKYPELSKRLGTQGIPRLMFYHNETTLYDLYGLPKKEDVMGILKDYL